MAEIDPVILQLKAQDAEYKSSLKDVIRLNDQVSGAILVAANKIDAAADRMIAAFQQMATSDKAAATAIAQAEAAKQAAVDKATAAIEAAATAQANSEKEAAAAIEAASRQVEMAKEQVAAAATEAAREEARAVQEAAIAEEKAAKEQRQAAADAAKAAKDAAKAAEKAANDEKRAHEKAADAAQKAARDKEIAAKRAADAIQANADRVQSGIRNIALSIGAYVTVNQLSEMSDSFTRLQNNLRIAGLEGEAMKAVQDRLFASAQKYGVEIEGLSNLYGQLTQASKELGASQSDIFGLTDAVSASLKITGISSQEASGALLQLTQALRGGKIQAEEYNSLLDGLYPLLEAAANGSTRFGGSVSKLTALVKDGKVSSQEFLQAILAGADGLEGKAANATLTLSAGYTTLNNALTVYFGEADKANGVSTALGETFGTIAQNLDTLIPAIAAISIGLGVNYVGAMAAARIATIQTQVATVGLRAALIGLVGNPVILAVGALAAGVAYLALTNGNASKSTNALTDQQQALNQVLAADRTDRIAGSTGKLTNARAQLTKETIALAKAEAYLRAQQAEKALNLAKRGVREEQDVTYEAIPGSRQRRPVITTREVALSDRRARGGDGSTEQSRALDAASKEFIAAGKAVNAVRAAEKEVANAPVTTPAATVADGPDKKKSRSGPTAEEITTRYNDDLSRLKAEQLQAELQVTTDAQKRADLQTELLDIEYKQRLADINASKEYSEERKAALRKELNALFGMDEKGSTVAGPANVYSAVFKDLSDQQKQMAQDALASEREALEAEADLITNRKDRLAAEQAILGIVEQEERQRLELQIANGQILDAAKARAELERRLAARREGLDRQYESPLEQRRREVRQTAANMGDAIEQIDIDAVDRLADGLANASTEYIKLGGIAGDVINGIIQDLVRLAAKQALFGSNGGAGIIGSIGSFLGLGGSSSVGGISAEAQSWLDNYTPKGFATGGYTGDGPRNEVAGVVHRGEYVIPANAVDRIGIQNLAALTSGDTSAARAMTGVTAAGMGARPVQQTVVVKVEANDYFDARVDQRATQVAAPIGVAASAQARNAAGSDATRAARRRIPGR
ncbi:tape measure protein [Sphingobium yanoikuyae]|uniref:tape measure protein n=1 Tax=Sphingobium yanoikuyae TaxID=13690 RepID=UPI000846CED7|nr:tape measure protein [Sphingobium yanoikuyae]